MSSSSDEEAREEKKRRFGREQIEFLERFFTTCPNPDERRRIEMSKKLGLKPHQIKNWFQNKRTSTKRHNKKVGNIQLSDESEKIRCEIAEMQTAVKNYLCSQCGVQFPSQEEEEQLLSLNNECVKTEINQCLEIITKQLGRSVAEMSLKQFHVVSNNTSMNIPLPPPPPPPPPPKQQQQQMLPVYSPISSSDKALLLEQATKNKQELVELAISTDNQYWIKPMYADKEILDRLNYRKAFKKPGCHLRNNDIGFEASRASGLVCMNPLSLVDIFMDPAKWTDLFQTVVAKAKIIDVISVGIGGNNHSGSLLLMNSEIGVLCPLVPSRGYYFARYCQKVSNGSWSITDMSVDFPGYFAKNRRLPSGCMIEEMPDGYSMVTWVEHLEVEESSRNLGVFHNFIRSGKAFGAQRWLATLQRMTERHHYMWMLGHPYIDTGGVILTQESKRSLMSLSHSMVRSFCSSLFPTNDWIIIMDSNEIKIRARPHQIIDNPLPDGIILNPITSVWLPFSTEQIFSFFKDESKRDLWDILSTGNMMQTITNVFTGFNIETCISLLRAGTTSNENPKLLLQETCIDSSVSMLIFASIDSSVMQIVQSGSEALNLPLISSGVAILPSCTSSVRMGPSSSSNPPVPGSFVTLSFQIPMNNQSTSDLNLDLLNSLNRMMSDAIKNVKTALNSP